MSRGKTPNQQTRRAVLRRSAPVVHNQNLGTAGTPWNKPLLSSFEIEPVKKLIRTCSGNVILRPTADDPITEQDLQTIAQMPYTTSMFVNSVLLLREYHNFQAPPTSTRQAEIKKDLSNLLIKLQEVSAQAKAQVIATGRITYNLDRRPAVFAVPTLAATHWNQKPPLVAQTRAVVAMPDGMPFQTEWASLGHQYTYARDMNIPKVIPAIEQILSNQEISDDDLMSIRVACLNWNNNEVNAITQALSAFEKKKLTPEQAAAYWRDN